MKYKAIMMVSQTSEFSGERYLQTFGEVKPQLTRVCAVIRTLGWRYSDT